MWATVVPDKDLAAYFGLEVHAVYSKAKRMGLAKRRQARQREAEKILEQWE